MNKVIKLVTLGDSGVGKDHFTFAFRGEKPAALIPTIGVDFSTAIRNIAGETVKFQIWTAAGSERFESLVPMYVRDAAIVFLIYDITKKSSFDHLKHWLELLRATNQDCQLFIIGNKLDLNKEREVTSEEAWEFAKKNKGFFMEVSAKDGKNIDIVIKEVENKVVSTEEQPEESKDKSTQAGVDSVKGKIAELRGYSKILQGLKNKEYFSSGPEKKAKAINALLAKTITKESLEKILKNEKDPLVRNRNILGNGFFRIKSKILGHTNPLREDSACQSETEWKLVQIYNAFSEPDEDIVDSEESSGSSIKN